MKAAIIFPNQLFKHIPEEFEGCEIILSEDPLFFGDWKYKAKFHKQKLAYHRATMKQYELYLIDKGYKVTYLNYQESYKNGEMYLFDYLIDRGVDLVVIYSYPDFVLNKRIDKYAANNTVKVERISSPMFLDSLPLFDKVFKNKKSYLMASFYSEQRKRLGILVDAKGQPKGGKWSFDEENRKKLPANIQLPKVEFPKQNKVKAEAVEYVNKNFSENYGELEKVLYPTNFDEAEQWLNNFLKQRFSLFGDYEDAIASKENWLFHSVLTPMLNNGLLTPHQVIEVALKAAEKYNVSLNSLEGFIRQIIGWREYMAALYEKEGVFMRTKNFWGFTQTMPKAFYTAETGVAPVDTVIKRLNKTAYNHHIERLMILGNFMLLCEIAPDEVYQWFMEMYIDAYDWVMVPNVYGMSQYADGGLICTKPYISGSAYVLKMSDFKKGEWCKIWDALYWRFIVKHEDVIKNNHRMRMMVAMAKKMDSKKMEAHINIAEDYLTALYAGHANKNKQQLV